jgi:RHS repeat-associated protein
MRFARSAWKENTGGTTYFLYDGMEPVCELNSSGSLTAVNTFGANGLLSRRVSSTSTFYTFDQQGGAAQRLDSGGGNIDTNQFDAFGNRIASTDSSTDPFSGYGAQWGYYTDSETGLELAGYRYYDPVDGRYLTRDPINYDGGINLYEYAYNDPSSYIDTDGLKPCRLPIPQDRGHNPKGGGKSSWDDHSGDRSGDKGNQNFGKGGYPSKPISQRQQARDAAKQAAADAKQAGKQGKQTPAEDDEEEHDPEDAVVKVMQGPNTALSEELEEEEQEESE